MSKKRREEINKEYHALLTYVRDEYDDSPLVSFLERNRSYKLVLKYDVHNLKYHLILKYKDNGEWDFFRLQRANMLLAYLEPIAESYEIQFDPWSSPSRLEWNVTDELTPWEIERSYPQWVDPDPDYWELVKLFRAYKKELPPKGDFFVNALIGWKYGD